MRNSWCYLAACTTYRKIVRMLLVFWSFRWEILGNFWLWCCWGWYVGWIILGIFHIVGSPLAIRVFVEIHHSCRKSRIREYRFLGIVLGLWRCFGWSIEAVLSLRLGAIYIIIIKWSKIFSIISFVRYVCLLVRGFILLGFLWLVRIRLGFWFGLLFGRFRIWRFRSLLL